MQNKKILWIVGIIIVVAIIVFGVNYWQSKSEQAQANQHPCAINFLSTLVYNLSASTTPSAVGKILLTQLLEQFKGMTACDTLGIKDYKIDSVGKEKFVQKDFTIPAVFDVLPNSKDKTLWATSSANWQGDWVRGYAMTLGIQNLSTTTTSESYRLVLQ